MKSLRANPDGIFITENLTPFRTNLTRRLAQLQFDKQIEAYWTSDGRIFVKRTETSRKEMVFTGEIIRPRSLTGTLML
jgi:hypothetical protein